MSYFCSKVVNFPTRPSKDYLLSVLNILIYINGGFYMKKVKPIHDYQIGKVHRVMIVTGILDPSLS